MTHINHSGHRAERNCSSCLLELSKKSDSIARIDQNGENRRIVIEAKNVTKELRTGDSCAVSGVCLTALDITPTSFAADLAPETWVRTSFSRIHPGAKVNLELPLAAHGRLGGHIVQGHVDGVGRLEAFERIADSDGFWLHVQVDRPNSKDIWSSRAPLRLKASA